MNELEATRAKMSREAFEKWWLKNYDGCGVNPNGKWSSKEKFWADHAWQAAQAEMQQQLLEAQAQVEVMREFINTVENTILTKSAYLETEFGKKAKELEQKAIFLISITPSEALQQYGYEQRALALEEAAECTGFWSTPLLDKTQKLRNKK